MKKEKWIIGEIEDWQKQQLISEQTAAILKERYIQKHSTNTLVIVFSIIGALLMGAGIILIFAKNWYRMPIPLKGIISMMPLLIAQGLAVFVVKRKYHSIAWREGVSVGLAASVFAALAMVSQSFHIPYDFGTYLLICGLLILPIIYILNAASPLIIYYYAIINWGAYDARPEMAVPFLSLFLAGVLYVFINRKRAGAKLSYISWVSAVAGFAAVWVLSVALDISALLMILAYFFLLVSAGNLPRDIKQPFEAVGTLGSLIILMILTYRFAWDYASVVVDLWFLVAAVIPFACGVYFGITSYKRNTMKLLFLTAILAMGIMRFVWLVFELDTWPYEFIFMLISNAIAGAVGVGFIVNGVKKASLSITNIGLASICLLIILRFFDTDMDFLWRGVVFLILGAAFLLVNMVVIKHRKRRGETGL